jgi:hypothetical protein
MLAFAKWASSKALDQRDRASAAARPMLARFTRNSAPFLKTSSAPECRWRKICKIEADRSFVSWILESAERCLVEQRRGASTLHYVRLRVALLIGFRGRTPEPGCSTGHAAAQVVNVLLRADNLTPRHDWADLVTPRTAAFAIKGGGHCRQSPPRRSERRW